MERRATLRDVAEKAGVTTATVSYILNDKKNFPDETKQRVMAAIAELGYIPNLSARTLTQRSSKLIGIVVPQTEGSRLMFQNNFYSEILGSIEFHARQNGYHIIISATDANESYLRLARERNLDGIIVIGMYPDEFYRQMKESRIPIVLVDSYCNDHYYHNIRIDDAYGSYLATHYVLSKGHRNIAFFSGQIKENGVMKKRLTGYRDALAEYDVVFDRRYVFEGKIDYASGIDAAERLLTSGVPATAVVAAADILAIGAMKGFYERGIRVPEDISVMGFDDLEISQYLTPGLSTIRQEISQKGEKAVELLINNIKEPNLTKQEQILPVQLVERGSVKCIGGEVYKKRPAPTRQSRCEPQQKTLSAKALSPIYSVSEPGRKINRKIILRRKKHEKASVCRPRVGPGPGSPDERLRPGRVQPHQHPRQSRSQTQPAAGYPARRSARHHHLFQL